MGLDVAHIEVNMSDGVAAAVGSNQLRRQGRHGENRKGEESFRDHGSLLYQA
jgi:hypothetical protein